MSAAMTWPARLATHDWVAQAHAGSDGGLLVVLGEAGVKALREQGRAQLLQTLQAYGEGLDSPSRWRLHETLADVADSAHVDALLAQPRPEQASILSERVEGEACHLELYLPVDLRAFDGHFPDMPILPGVTQIGWALSLAAPRLGTPTQCQEMEALKFQRLLRPCDRVELRLQLDRARGKLHFGYHLDEGHASSGRLRLELADG